MALTNEQRKKRRVVPNTPQDVLDRPALPPNVIPFQEDRSPVIPPTPVRPRRPREEGIVPEFARGIESGVETVQGLREGFFGAVAGALGDEEEAERRLAREQERLQAAALNPPSIERVQDVRLGEEGGLGRAADFVAGIAGKQGVIFGTVLAGAAAGAATRTLPLVGRGPGVAPRTLAGAVGTGAGLETGEAFQSIAGDPVAVEKLGVPGVSRLALGTGAVAGSFEAVPAVAAVRRIGLLKPFQRAIRGNLIQRFGTGAAAQAALEGGTEAAQTIVQRTAARFANENREILGEEGFDELLNAAVTGAIFGAGIGGITGAIGGRVGEPGTVDDQVDLEETLDELDLAGGRSTDVEAEIDRLGEIGQDIRDARATPSESAVFRDPESAILDLTRISLEEGGLPSFRSRSRLLAAVRELENPQVQLPGLLADAGVSSNEAPIVAQQLLDAADVEQVEELQDLATAPSQGTVAQEDEPTEDDPGEKQFSIDDGFSDLHVTKNFIFRNANKALGFAPPERAGRENSLTRAVAQLEKDFPDIEFDTIGLGDAIVEELPVDVRNNPEELITLLNDVVQQKLDEPRAAPANFREPDPADPLAYLNQWSAIRRTQISDFFFGSDELRLTDLDVFGGPTKGFVTPGRERVEATGEVRKKLAVRQPRQKPLVAERKPNQEADVVVSVPVKKQKLGPDKKPLLKDGKPVVETVQENRTLDAVKLTNLMMTKLEIEARRTVDRVGFAFFSGLSSLGSRGITIDTKNIDPTTVVSKKGGFDITYGEISTSGAGRIRARIAGFKAEQKRAVDKIQENILKLSRANPEAARRLKFINKKLKRRIKKIPGDIETMLAFGKSTAANVRHLARLMGETKGLLDAEQAELEDWLFLAGLIDDMVFNLRREGVHTVAVEQLAESVEEMQRVADIAEEERGRIRLAKAAPGSQDAFFQEAPETGARTRQEEIDIQRQIGALIRQQREDENSVSGRAFQRGRTGGPKLQNSVQAKGDALLNDLNLDVEVQLLIRFNEIRSWMLANNREDWVRMRDGELMGKRYLQDDGSHVIVVNPLISNENLSLELMAHEIGHVVLHEKLVKEDKTVQNRIVAEYKKWREVQALDTPGIAVQASRSAFETARYLLEGADSKALQDKSKAEVEYILSFQEWFADNVARWFVKQPQPKKGLSKLEATFKDIADSIKETFEKIIKKFGFRPARTVREYMDQLVHPETDQEVEILSKDFSKLLETAGLDSDTPAVAGVLQALDPFGKSTPMMLRKAFKQVLSEEERNTLFRFFSRASQRRRLKELAGTDAQKDLIENNPLHAAVFGYQMWIAGEFTIKSQGRRVLQDQAGISQEDVAGPVSQFVLDIFTKLFDSLSSIFGVVHADQKAEQILEAIREGVIDQRKAGQVRWRVMDHMTDTLLQRIGGTVNTGFQHLVPFFERALVVADQRMLDSGIPGLQKIARGYHAAVGEERQPETFFEARQTKVGLFMSSYNRLTAPLRADADLKADVLAAMRNPKKATKNAEVQAIASALFKFNRRFRNYLVAAGLKLGDKGPRYFPWVWDPRKVQDNTDFLTRLLNDERFDKEVNAWLKRRNDEIENFNVTKAQGIPEKPKLRREQLVDEIVLSLQQNEGYVDTELNPNQTGTTPWFASMHTRALGFLVENNKLTTAEREQFDSLFSDQMDLIMMTYIRQGVKRAEYARRFGARSEKLQQFLQEARAEGASAEQMRAAYQYIDAMNGVLGESTNQRVSKMLNLGARQGEIINPHWRTFTSLMMVIQNMAVLPLATLTSLVDPVGIMVRSQDMNATMAALRTGAQEIATEIKLLTKGDEKAARSEVRKLAEGMGVIEDHMTNEALEWEYGSTYLTPRLKATNEFFFKAIGLTQWTRVTRIMALAGGKEFIKRHVQRPNENSARFLRQLNLDPADVKFDAGGDLVILTRMQRETDGALSKEELERDNRVRNALNRFVNESILRPNAAQRPIWASDPNYALVFHLKSFMFSFHDRILRRTFQEAALGNVTPLILLTAFVPAMLFADILRDMIRFGLDGNPRKAHWGLEDHIWEATQRSGVNGIGQLLIDAKNDVQFGGFGYESLIGPTADGISDLDGLFSDDNEEQWRAFGRNLPGNAVWKHWLENGFDEQ